MANRRLYQLGHCQYICTYHLVWVTRYRGKMMADTHIKLELKRLFKTVAKWKGFIIQSWHVGDEHIHLVMTIPPKYSVAYAVQVMKGKSSAWIKKKTKKIPKGTFWARGYFASTVGLDEHMVRNYVRNQEHHQVDIPKFPLFGRR
jgi:putative transposase